MKDRKKWEGIQRWGKDRKRWREVEEWRQEKKGEG